MITHIKNTLIIVLLTTFCLQSHVIVQSTPPKQYTLYSLDGKETKKIYIVDTGQVQEKVNKIITNKAYVIQQPKKRPKKRKFLGYFYKEDDAQTKYYVYK